MGVGADKLKKAMLDFLVFEEEMIFQGFIPMEKLRKDTPNDDIAKATQKLTDLAGRENEVLDHVNKAQEEYAAANGFTIAAPGRISPEQAAFPGIKYILRARLKHYRCDTAVL